MYDDSETAGFGTYRNVQTSRLELRIWPRSENRNMLPIGKRNWARSNKTNLGPRFPAHKPHLVGIRKRSPDPQCKWICCHSDMRTWARSENACAVPIDKYPGVTKCTLQTNKSPQDNLFTRRIHCGAFPVALAFFALIFVQPYPKANYTLDALSIIISHCHGYVSWCLCHPFVVLAALRRRR